MCGSSLKSKSWIVRFRIGAKERAERAKEKEMRREEMQSYRETMEKMISDNSKEMQAVSRLVRSLLQQSKDKK